MPKAKIILQLGLVLVLITALFPFFPRSVSADDLKWSRVNIPANGVGGKWVLAKGSDIRHLTRAADGTLYCYANPADTPYRLFKSSDGGYSWSYTGRVEDIIVDISILPDNPDCIYYATASAVFKSSDAGNTFAAVALGPDIASGSGPQITSLDTASIKGSNFLVIGTCHITDGKYGGVYLLDESQPAVWQDTGIGSFNVYTVAFSPHFSEDRQIVAITANETDTFITSNTSESGWGQKIGPARIAGLVPQSAVMAFPADYNSDLDQGKCTQFIALNSGSDQGDVYLLKGRKAPLISEMIDLNAGLPEGKVNLDIASLAVSGNADQANLMVGAANTTGVYFSNNSGGSWTCGIKSPSGNTETRVLMDPDFTTRGLAYAVTAGNESAFSISRDRGATWNQTALIDTSLNTILDFTVSPDFKKDSTLFLLTAGEQNSLWYSSDGGLKWERVCNTTLAGIDKINLVTLSPNYAQNKKVFFSGTSKGNPAIWKSEDNGCTFNQSDSKDPVTAAPVNVDAWVITPQDAVFTASFDGDKCRIYQTAPNGLTYIDKTTAGNQSPNSLLLSPDYENDHTILTGNSDGSVFFSRDNGHVFDPLPLDATGAPLSGAISVAFDTDYKHNKTVYAASDEKGKGIFRFGVDSSINWEPIDSSLPQGARISRILTSSAGTLYGVYFRNEKDIANKSGLERTLAPSATSPFFETITGQLADSIALNKLWEEDNILWTIDTINNQLLTYTDIMTSPVILTSPANMTPGLATRNVVISWEPLAGATNYHWQVDTDNNFASIPEGLEGETDSAVTDLPSLSWNMTYYWRVKASQPVTSPWSAIWSFNTIPAIKIAAPSLIEPKSTSRSSLLPVFKWSASEGAEFYELLVARDDAFSDLVINKTGEAVCYSNAWVCDVILSYNSSYYWKVRAVGGGNSSTWSDVDVFTTVTAPSYPPSNPNSPSTKTPKPSPSSQPSASPSLTPSPVSTPAPLPSPPPASSTPQALTVALSNTTSPIAAISPAPNITPLPGTPPLPALSATLTSSNLSPQTDSPDSSLRLMIILAIGLVVLLLVLVGVIIFTLKKLRKY